MQRISALLLLWWYYHTEGLRVPTRFLKAIRGKQSAQRYPDAKEADASIRAGLMKSLVRDDEELEVGELEKRVEKRMRYLIMLAQNTDIEAPIESDDDADSTTVALNDC